MTDTDQLLATVREALETLCSEAYSCNLLDWDDGATIAALDSLAAELEKRDKAIADLEHQVYELDNLRR